MINRAASSMPPLPLYILSGGHSSRFGADKARADVLGRPLIVHLADALKPIARSITVVADSAGKYADLGLRTIADATPDQGPLGGLQSALADCCETSAALADCVATSAAHPWLLAVSCDWVGVKPAWVEQLWQAVQEKGAVRAAAFKAGRWEPLFALYHTSLCEDVDRALAPVSPGATAAPGQRSLWRILEAAQAAAVPLPPDWQDMAQINTPEALAAWLARKSR